MIYVITGQTATGKTKRALELASQKNGEIINFDSRQIYKKLDIITGKDLYLTDRKYMLVKNVGPFDIGYYSIIGSSRLWLYDIADPRNPFSAFDYRLLALEVIKDIQLREKTPIIVGGTYFYLQQLLYDILDTPIPPNPELRAELEKESTQTLKDILFTENFKVFKELNNSERHNRQRLIRKIEITRAGHEITRNTKEDYQYALPFSEKDTVIEGYYMADRDKHRKSIKARIAERLNAGAVQEVEALLRYGYTAEHPGLQTIGYKQILRFLMHEINTEEMQREWLNKEIQYAKRQYTFAKRDPNISWIEV